MKMKSVKQVSCVAAAVSCECGRANTNEHSQSANLRQDRAAYHAKLLLMKKKTLRETQILHDGCKAEPKKFALLQTPFPEAQDGQNLISWRWSLPSPTGPVW